MPDWTAAARAVDWLIVATRLRVVLIVAGLGWVLGIDVPPGTRAALAVLTVAGIVADGVLEQQIRHHHDNARSRDRYRTAA